MGSGGSGGGIKVVIVEKRLVQVGKGEFVIRFAEITWDKICKGCNLTLVLIGGGRRHGSGLAVTLDLGD